jgi:hypothetical protein
LVADSHTIVPRWRNHFSQPLNTLRVNGVRQRELHTEGLLVPEPSVFEFDLAIENLKGHKSPSIVLIIAELIKASVGRVRYESMNLLFIFAIRTICWSGGRN